MKTTKKEIEKNYKNIIRINYCDLQNLLYFKNRDFFTSGIYGWNADIYKINYKTVICTGYRPFGNINIKNEIIKKYNDLACKILNSKAIYEEKKEKIENLLNEFVNFCLQGKQEV